MKKIFNLTLSLGLALLFVGCSKDKSASSDGGKKEVWVYTSLYKDTIDDLKGRLTKDFPDTEFKWFQAGSEEIATKVNAEILAGKLQADLLISSDRFWYEEMAQNGKLAKFDSPSNIPAQLKHPEGLYTTLSLPVMVLVYNAEILKNDYPTSYKALADAKWKGKVTTGSPLASGTNFTTMAMLQHHYGWEYFTKLKSNGTIAQGGNSSTLRRIQSGERPVGWVLLENVLRLIKDDKRLRIVYPKDGVVTHANVLAVTKKSGNRDHVKAVAKWMFEAQGQDSMVKSYMYSPLPGYKSPEGAPSLEDILANAFEWTPDFLKNVTKERVALKEKYTEIMFQ